MKPKIGIVICSCSDHRQSVSDAYIQVILKSGGIPLVLPFVKSSASIEAYRTLCDGFLFCGGEDITPLLFGQEPRQGIGRTDISLDLFQIRLMKQILQTQKPVLAICRGMQILNVACGGTICQDIFSQCEDALNHMQHSARRSEISHKISCVKGSLLHRLTGPYLFVNSYHHQTVEHTGHGLVISALASDGSAEAIEMPSHPFVLGVQWHPECMFRSSFDMRRLFSVFLQKCL